MAESENLFWQRGFIVPLFSIFFKLKLAVTPEQIGTIFALGSVTLAIGTFLAPAIANKLGKVKAVVTCQYLSMPFIMGVALAPNLPLATFAYLVRGALMKMAGPINTTLQMEMVSENERATTSGLMIIVDNIPQAITASISGVLMTGNDFYSPFLFTTATYFSASSQFYLFFRKTEKNRRNTGITKLCKLRTACQSMWALRTRQVFLSSARAQTRL